MLGGSPRRIDQITGPVAHHAEGPVWSDQWGGLRWVDMLTGDILSLTPSGTVERRHVGTVAAALRPRRGGGAVIGVERGFVLEDVDGSLNAVAEAWTDPEIRMNDGGCDPDGRFYCGSMAYDLHAGGGALYRFDPDRSVHRVFEDVTISNGIEWSPDGSRAYYNDTATSQVDVFDYDSETGLTNRRPFAKVSPDDGRPDGLTVDAEGGVWVALNRGGSVRRYSAAGDLDDVIELPTKSVTACTFGGVNLDELFITTSQENLKIGEDPVAGSVFRAQPGVIGLPAREFWG